MFLRCILECLSVASLNRAKALCQKLMNRFERSRMTFGPRSPMMNSANFTNIWRALRSASLREKSPSSCLYHFARDACAGVRVAMGLAAVVILGAS